MRPQKSAGITPLTPPPRKPVSYPEAPSVGFFLRPIVWFSAASPARLFCRPGPPSLRPLPRRANGVLLAVPVPVSSQARSAGVLAIVQATRAEMSPAERAFMAEMKDMENYADRQQVRPAAQGGTGRGGAARGVLSSDLLFCGRCSFVLRVCFTGGVALPLLRLLLTVQSMHEHRGRGG